MTENGRGPRLRTLVLVAGSGRSGTSLFSGILQRLGYTVPAPEVPADASNPRGFAESQWVVDFHDRLLRAARVQAADARPAAWAEMARVGLDEDVRGELRSWLAAQFAVSDDLIVKDPRLSWFLPLWRACAADVGAEAVFVTMLRHPAAVIDSKTRWYGGGQGEAGRAAGWVNQTLFTERATRESPRAFVRYEDLLEDWTETVARVGRELDLRLVRDAPAAAIRDVHGFIDRTLSRSAPQWNGQRLPAPLRAQADEVWELVSALADTTAAVSPGADDGPTAPASAGNDAATSADRAAAGGGAAAIATSAETSARLDAVRAAYVGFYAEAEAVAQSSIAAARRGAIPASPEGRLPRPLLIVIRRVPGRWRHAVPMRVRHGLARALRSAPAR